MFAKYAHSLSFKQAFLYLHMSIHISTKNEKKLKSRRLSQHTLALEQSAFLSKEKKTRERKRKEISPPLTTSPSFSPSQNSVPPSHAPSLNHPPSNTNPHHTNNNIHPLALPALKLITPHPIPLIIPISPTGTMHTPPANLPLLTLILLLLLLRARVAQMLDNRAVDGEFVAVRGGGGVGFFVGGFGDQGLQDFVDDAVVPLCGCVVLVACCAAEGGGAGVRGDLG